MFRVQGLRFKVESLGPTSILLHGLLGNWHDSVCAGAGMAADGDFAAPGEAGGGLAAILDCDRWVSACLT